MNKFLNDYGFGAIIILLLVAYGVNCFCLYLNNKGNVGLENQSSIQGQYKDTNQNASASVKPSEENGNETFASANGAQTSMPGMPSSCANKQVQNPADLLPNDKHSEWAQLNPSGQGELSSINLLKAGHHIGIDTVGQSLRNSNLQIRSEPPNPQQNVGPWNNTTIEPDFMRPPLEIGSSA